MAQHFTRTRWLAKTVITFFFVVWFIAGVLILAMGEIVVGVASMLPFLAYYGYYAYRGYRKRAND